MKRVFKVLPAFLIAVLLAQGSNKIYAKEVYLQEDFNQDGIVDLTDMALMAKEYNSNSIKYDLNKDSIVNIFDLVKVGQAQTRTSYGAGIVKSERINIRSGPGTTFQDIGDLYYRDKFVIVDDLGEWYKIKFQDSGVEKFGYVFAAYTLPLKDNYFESYLGFISSKYESTIFNGNEIKSFRNPGTISNNAGDAGGKSYGIFQLASKVGSVDEFLNWMHNTGEAQTDSFYNDLINAKLADGNTFGTNFDIQWEKIAKDHMGEFFELQRSYAMHRYFEKASDILKQKYNFDIKNKSFALKEALWSAAVQYGIEGNGSSVIGAVDIFVQAGLNKSEEELLVGIYEVKIKHAESINNVILKNRATDELKDVLSIYKGTI